MLLELAGTNSLALEAKESIQAFGEGVMKTIKKDPGEDQTSKLFLQDMLTGYTMVLLLGLFVLSALCHLAPCIG